MGMDRDDEGFSEKPEHETAPKQVPAIGYSILCNMGGDRQMTVQCFVGEDESEDVIAARMDKVFRVVDRQKARYDLDKLYKEFEEAGRHLRNFLNAIPIAEHQAKHQIAVLEAELSAMQDAKKEVFNQGYEQHTASKRRGPFEPSGALKGRLNAMEQEIQKKRDRIRQVPEEQRQHRDQTLINVQKYQDDLRRMRLKINDTRTLAGLGPYEEFLAEETASPLEAKGA